MQQVVIVSAADLARPGESLAADDWAGREPGESLAHFRARKEISRLADVNQRARAQIKDRERKIRKLREVQ